MSSSDLVLSFPSSVAPDLTQVLRTLAASLRSLALREDLADAHAYRLNLILDELLTNVLSHGVRPGGTSPHIVLQVSCSVASVEVLLSDDGPRFDPLSAPLRSPVDLGGDVPVGGLGLRLVRSLAHSLSYHYLEGRNCLTLVLCLR